jgi:hypothetical protein
MSGLTVHNVRIPFRACRHGVVVNHALKIALASAATAAIIPPSLKGPPVASETRSLTEGRASSQTCCGALW